MKNCEHYVVSISEFLASPGSFHGGDSRGRSVMRCDICGMLFDAEIYCKYKSEFPHHTIRVREQRFSTSQEDSYETVYFIEPTLDSLCETINSRLRAFGRQIKKEDIKVTKYLWDSKTGWDNHIIEIQNYGVYGYTDAPLEA